MKQLVARIALVALFVLTMALGFYVESKGESLVSSWQIEAVDWSVISDSTSDTLMYMTQADYDSSATYESVDWEEVCAQMWVNITCDTCHANRRDSSVVHVYLVGANYDGAQWALIDSAVVGTDTLVHTFKKFTMQHYKYVKFVMLGKTITKVTLGTATAIPSLRIRAVHWGRK